MVDVVDCMGEELGRTNQTDSLTAAQAEQKA
jgi:hypothetical protein